MCSERDVRAALREGPVDRRGVCCCSVPDSVQVILRKVEILSFDDPKGVGSAIDKITTYALSDREAKAA